MNYKSADIICLAETKLMKNDLNSDYAMADFQEIIRNDQVTRNKKRPPHGIAMYVRQLIEKEHIKHFNTNNFEFTLTRIFPLNFRPTVQLAIVYKSPSCSKDEMFEGLKSLKSQTRSFEQLIVLGDFNTEAFNEDNTKTSTIKEIDSTKYRD